MKKISLILTLIFISLSACNGKSNSLNSLQETQISRSNFALAADFQLSPEDLPTLDLATLGIRITDISYKEDESTLQITWDSSGSTPKGYKIIYSDHSAAPLFPEDPSIYIDEQSEHQAVIQAESGKTYYVRVCKFNGVTCSEYTDTYTFTTPDSSSPEPTAENSLLLITGISNVSEGKAEVEWKAEGSFEKGFKVVWSADSQYPVYPGDEYVYINDSDARSAMVSGEPGTRYYFRVCAYDGSGCSLYSQTISFTYEGESSSDEDSAITITGINNSDSGKAVITWNANGSFSKGFKVVWSDSTSSPVYPGNTYVYLSSSEARSATVTGNPGVSYYFRVCRYTGSGCDVYSQSVSFTFAGASSSTSTPSAASISITGISDAGSGKGLITWSADGSFSKGFKVVWSDSTSSPVYPGNTYVYLSSSEARSATVTGDPGVTYYFRVCRYTGGACDVYSQSVVFTFAGGASATATTIPATATIQPTAIPTVETVIPPTEVPPDPTEISEPTAENEALPTDTESSGG